MRKSKNDDELERLTEELTVQLGTKFMQVKNELVRQDGDPSSWAWFYDERPYPLASSIIQMLGAASLEERDIIYLISMAIVSKLRVDPDRVIRLHVGDLAKKIVERLRAPAVECSFCVPISTGRGLQLALNIDGPKKLKIQKPGMKSDEAIALCGSVNAIHEYHAARQIEADVKSVLGVLISMRIAQPLPIPVYEIPLITFQNWPALLSAEATPQPAIAIPLDPMVGGLASRIQFSVPDDLNELEMKRFRTGEDPNPSLERRLRGLVNLLTNDSERTRELRSAAALLFDAFAAPEPGKAIALAFMSMEAVLLDAKTTESIVARLSEAVAYRLGTSAEQRTELRKRVSKLYKARSGFVHTGKVDQPSTAVSEAREMAATVLRREIGDLNSETQSQVAD